MVDWNQGPTPAPNVRFARQNLPLIVDEGRLNPNLSNGGEWGATVGNAVLVWRSGIGVDRRGNPIYAAGEDQTVKSIAETLLRAGAVRAMELDINSYWVSFITYGAPSALDPENRCRGWNAPTLAIWNRTTATSSPSPRAESAETARTQRSRAPQHIG